MTTSDKIPGLSARPINGPAAALLRKQFGVLSRSQALGLGLTARTLRYRTRRAGPWQAILPGVYLTVTGVPTLDQRDMAAALYGGAFSVLTGQAALRRYEILTGRSRPDFVDVLVPAERHKTGTDYVRIHRTTRLPDRILIEQALRLAYPARAVTDAALQATNLRDMRAIVAAGVQRGRCTPDQLAAELGHSRLASARMMSTVLSEIRAGLLSPAEGDLMDLIRRAGLPEPLWNPRLYLGDLYLGKPDAWWGAVSVAVEVDSREYHFYQEGWEQTLQRHDRMTAAGIRMLHISPRQIRTRPDWVIGLIRQALTTGSPVPGLRCVPAYS